MKNIPDENNNIQLNTQDEEDDRSDSQYDSYNQYKDDRKNTGSIFDLFKNFLEPPVGKGSFDFGYKNVRREPKESVKKTFRYLHSSILKNDYEYSVYIYLGVPAKYISCSISSRKFIVKNTRQSEEKFCLIHTAYNGYSYYAHSYDNGVLIIKYKYLL